MQNNWDFAKAPKQDMLPPGGFPYTRIKRLIPTKGFRGSTMLFGMFGIMFYCTLERFEENRFRR